MADKSEQEPIASERPQPKRKRGFWNTGKILLLLAVVALAGVILWQVLGREKANPKGERTLLTLERPAVQPAPVPEAPPAPPEKVLTEAEKILLKCASTYAQANSWRAAYSLDAVSGAGPERITQTASVVVALKKPSMYYQTSQGTGPMGVSLNSATVADGTNVYTYVESLRQALKTVEPKSLVELAQVLTPEMPERVSEFSLMAGRDPLESVATVTLVATEEVNGRSCHVLDLDFKGEGAQQGLQGVLQGKGETGSPPKKLPFRATEGSQRLWIDAEDFLIRKQRLDMKMDLPSAAQAIFGGQVRSSDLPEEADQTMIQTYSEVHLNEDLPDSWFVFAPPEGVRIVDRLDFSGLLGEMLGGD